LWGVHSNKKRLDATFFCMLYDALRYGAVFVDVSS